MRLRQGLSGACFPISTNWGVYFLGVLVIRAVLFGPDFEWGGGPWDDPRPPESHLDPKSMLFLAALGIILQTFGLQVLVAG